jgi:integrase
VKSPLKNTVEKSKERRIVMALLQECPSCKKRLPLKSQNEVGGEKVSKVRDRCPSCGFKLRKASGKVYWIEYYYEGRRRRERIGTNKALAQTVLQKRLVQRAEDRLLDKKKGERIRFNQLTEWYLNLSEVKSKKSYERDVRSTKKLKAFFGSRLVKEITPALIESYRKHSMNELNYKRMTNKPATVNREIACLKTIFSKAVKNRKIEYNSASAISQLKENNERNRVLSIEEWGKYRGQCPSWYFPIAMMAYFTGMRRGEIINLAPSRVDLKTGFIRLRPEDTKTETGRSIPIHPDLAEALKDSMKVRPLNFDRVFHRNGKLIEASTVRETHEAICKKAGIENFRFHDFRHTRINNWRKEGHDYFKIMAASGHKTMSVFKRYNMVDEAELKTLINPVDTYMDTKGKIQEQTRVGVNG